MRTVTLAHHTGPAVCIWLTGQTALHHPGDLGTQGHWVAMGGANQGPVAPVALMHIARQCPQAVELRHTTKSLRHAPQASVARRQTVERQQRNHPHGDGGLDLLIGRTRGPPSCAQRGQHNGDRVGKHRHKRHQRRATYQRNECRSLRCQDVRRKPRHAHRCAQGGQPAPGQQDGSNGVVIQFTRTDSLQQLGPRSRVKLRHPLPNIGHQGLARRGMRGIIALHDLGQHFIQRLAGQGVQAVGGRAGLQAQACLGLVEQARLQRSQQSCYQIIGGRTGRAQAAKR